MDENKPSFWTTLPGILLGLAALVTAIGGIYFGISRNPQPAPNSHPTATSTQPTQQAAEPIVQKFTGPMGPLESGISYSSGDLYSRPSQSPEECSNLCSNDDRCRAVTFIISQQRCWIKNQVNAPQQSSDMVSARKGG